MRWQGASSYRRHLIIPAPLIGLHNRPLGGTVCVEQRAVQDFLWFAWYRGAAPTVSGVVAGFDVPAAGVAGGHYATIPRMAEASGSTPDDENRSASEARRLSSSRSITRSILFMADEISESTSSIFIDSVVEGTAWNSRIARQCV